MTDAAVAALQQVLDKHRTLIDGRGFKHPAVIFVAKDVAARWLTSSTCQWIRLTEAEDVELAKRAWEGVIFDPHRWSPCDARPVPFIVDRV